MFHRLNLSGERLLLLRTAYRDACLELGIDPSEKALTVRVAIIERLLLALETGEEDVAALTELCVAPRPNSPRPYFC